MTDKLKPNTEISHVVVDFKDEEVNIYEEIPQDHDFYALIGKLVASWGQIEHVMDSILWELMGENHAVNSAITLQIGNINQKMKAVESVMKIKNISENTRKNIKKLNDKIRDESIFRNRIVHDPWYICKTKNEINRFVSYHSSEDIYGFKVIKNDEILKHLEKAKDFTISFYKIYNQIRTEIHSLPEK